MKSTMQSPKLDILHGSIRNKLPLYALPVAATGILEQLFNAADIAIVGNFASANRTVAIAAVGANSPIIGVILNLFIGISLGTNVVIANAIGRKDRKAVEQAVHTSILAAFIGGLIVTLLGELFIENILTLLNVPSDVFPYALLYIRIYLLGMPVIFLYNFEAAIFRSTGDTKVPLWALAFSGVLNILLNLIFVIFFRMTVNGVAIATVISNVVIQSAINSLGTVVIAASSAAFNIEILVYYVFNSFSQACTTFVGQNYGAGQIKRCKRTFLLCLTEDSITSVAAIILILCSGKFLLSLFNRDPQVIAIGYSRLLIIFTAYIFSMLYEVMSGYLRGFEISFIPAVLTTIGVCGIRVAWVYTAFPKNRTFHTLLLAYPISLSVTALLILIALLIYHPSHRVQTFKNNSENCRRNLP